MSQVHHSSKGKTNIHLLFSFTDESNCYTLGKNYEYILGNCYYFEGTAYGITKAFENCRDRFKGLGNSGRLFEPRSKLLNDAVIQEARKTITTSPSFFLGIQDSNSQNNWQYISSKENVSWFNWHSGEPQNYRGVLENCVSPYFKTNSKWYDYPCSQKIGSICEMTTEGNFVYYSTLAVYIFQPIF